MKFYSLSECMCILHQIKSLYLSAAMTLTFLKFGHIFVKGGDFMNSKDADKLFEKLSPEQQKKVKNILADKAQTEKILKTPQAQALLKKLMGENKNG